MWVIYGAFCWREGLFGESQRHCDLSQTISFYLFIVVDLYAHIHLIMRSGDGRGTAVRLA